MSGKHRPLLLTGVSCLAALGLLCWLYVFSFDHSCARFQRDAPSTASLVIGGIPLPYNSFTTGFFSKLYAPLIERREAAKPRQTVTGPLYFVSNDTTRIMVKDQPTEGISFLVPATMWWRVNALKQGEPVLATYRSVSMPDRPFCDTFELVSIARVAKN